MRRSLLLLARIFRGLANRFQELGTERYYTDDLPARDVLLAGMLESMRRGTPWHEVIRNPRASVHGERIAEYTYVYGEIARRPVGALLDVGCVLNNPTFDRFLPRECDVSFLNPASEPIVRQRATYYRRPLAEYAGPGFPLVTCLSTLEHIGFDNTRYGTNLTDEGWDWPRAEACIVENVERLCGLVTPGGTLVVSFPYGRREFVRLPPGRGPRVWQVLHPGHVGKLRASPLLKDAELVFVRLGASGWEIVDEDAEFAAYGRVSCGASGLLILRWHRT